MSDHSFLPAWREQSLGRRVFLRVSAASAATVALVATGCVDSPTPVVTPDPHQLAMPIGNKGLLYYLYLLAIAQATTYQKVVDAPPADLTAAERVLFSHMRDHEVVHRETIKYIIDPTGANALFPTDFAFNLTPFNLTTRAGVLAAALQLEDLATAAYAGILPLFSSTNLSQRVIFLKMSTVDARHAATVRDLIAPGTFASSAVVDSSGQLLTKKPAEVLAALAPFYAPYVFSITCPDTSSDLGLCSVQ